MITLTGKYNSATVYTDRIDRETEGQIYEILRMETVRDSKIRIMPDTHIGNGCVVGMTMTVEDSVNPRFIGVDIGCGMETVLLLERELDLPRLDETIQKRIPSGAAIHKYIPDAAARLPLDELLCAGEIDLTRARQSLGTLGGGNHFIEVDQSEDGRLYLVIHSGSRSLGAAVCRYYESLAYRSACRRAKESAVAAAYAECPHDRRAAEEKAERLSKSAGRTVSEASTALTGEDLAAYLHDLAIVQAYAERNRRLIAETILSSMKLHAEDRFSCVHNYIDTKQKLLRKGAVSAARGERVIIPMNMRDGSLLCRGLGNPDWNASAPHGAGRILSRGEAKELLTMEEYREAMQGIYTTTAKEGSLDESPMAYRDPKDILRFIGDTVTVEKIIRPIYNFKACKS